MARPEEIVQAARSSGIQVTLFSGLEPVRTVIEIADRLDRSLAEVANTVLLTVHKEPVLVLVPGDRQVDGIAIAQRYRTEALKVSLSTRRQAEELTGYQTALIPPFGLDQSIDILLDEHFLEHDTIVLPSGSPHALIEANPEELATLPNATVGEWSRPHPD